jgi:hypothetical protein
MHVVQATRGTPLLEPPEPAGVVGKLRRQDLDRHVAAQPRVGRAVHLSHGAGAQTLADLVRTQARSAIHRRTFLDASATANLMPHIETANP